MNYKANSEEALAIKISDYLKTQYPDVIFHFDYGSGLKMTKRQAIRQKRLNKHRGYPDLFIAKLKIDDCVGSVDYQEPSYIGASIRGQELGDEWNIWAGLMIELKKEGTRLKKKDGEWASEHIAEQADMLEKLKKGGYVAEFACGFEQAKKIIDNYLKNN